MRIYFSEASDKTCKISNISGGGSGVGVGIFIYLLFVFLADSVLFLRVYNCSVRSVLVVVIDFLIYV
jgi:hypothetical protein